MPRARFAFSTDAKKVTGFTNWLQQQVNDGILEVKYGDDPSRDNWMNTYIESSYKKGMARASVEIDKNVKGPAKAIWERQQDMGIGSGFFRPEHAAKVGMIYTRAYSELKGVTDAMDQQISRALAQGLTDGKGPMQIAREINDRVDAIGINRARMIARTEIIRAHHTATIETYREARIEGVMVQAEWSTAGDDGVCDECAGLEGRIFTLDEIEGMIPLHPNCLLDGQVPVYTSKGWRPIKLIKVGDRVLTHLGRFREVMKLHRTGKQKPIAVRICVGNGHNAERLSLTGNHPVLVQAGKRTKWMFVKDVTTGMSVKYLADKCARCGKPIPWFKKYCSQVCISKDITDRQWGNPEHRKNISAKASAQMKREYNLGLRDADKTTSAAHKAVREKERLGLATPNQLAARSCFGKTGNTKEHRQRSSESQVEDEVARMVSNHSGKYAFLGMKVIRVDRWTVRSPRTLYNLTVDEDESYLAHGFVVHNCRCCAIPANVGEAKEEKPVEEEER